MTAAVSSGGRLNLAGIPMLIPGQFSQSFWQIFKANADAELRADPEIAECFSDYFKMRDEWARQRLEDFGADRSAHQARMCLIRYHEQSAYLMTLLPPAALQ